MKNKTKIITIIILLMLIITTGIILTIGSIIELDDNNPDNMFKKHTNPVTTLINSAEIR